MIKTAQTLNGDKYALWGEHFLKDITNCYIAT